jgi:hypothetical protein
MEDIAIKYWSHHGWQEEKKFQINDTKIDLVMRAAKKIDLSNISKCRSLQTLDISHNMLDELDLAPLSGCSSLTELRIQNNHLTGLNLWPLINCIGLREVDLSKNSFHSLDISPIFLRTNIRMDSSVVISADSLLQYIFTTAELRQHFQLIRPDAAPWTAPPVIMWLTYLDLAKNNRWFDIKKRIDYLLGYASEDQWFSAQRGLLNGLGMTELAGYDGDPKNLLESVDCRISLKEARHIIYDNAIRLLEIQLESNGPTLFLDIEEMRKTRASKLIPEIVERRKIEVESIIVPIKGSKVFLESLWMTHYGFQLLGASNMELVTNLAGFNTIKDSFEDLGITIQTQDVSTAPHFKSNTISKSMHHHILNFIRGYYDW